jgi:hypothetical protein
MFYRYWKSKFLRTIGRLSITGILVAAVAATAFTIALTQPASADQGITPPSVPTDIQVPAGNIPYLVGHAVGTQNYICLPSGSGFQYVLFTPQATLFNEDMEQITTHFFSPNPDEGGTVRAAWQHSQDTSTVWGRVLPGDSYTGSDYVAPGAIAWLLVTIVGDQAGPTGGDKLTKTTYIQRVNTSGGVAPSTGCASSADIGHPAFVPYTTDYYFYRAAPRK